MTPIEVKLESLLFEPGGQKKVEVMSMDIDPIYETLQLHVGECIYSIDNKGHIKEKLAPEDPYSAWMIFSRARKLSHHLLEHFPESYEELIGELVKDLPDDEKKLEMLKQFITLMMTNIICYNLPDKEVDYMVEARSYASGMRDSIAEGNRPVVGSIKTKEEPLIEETPSHHEKQEEPGFFKKLFNKNKQTL